MNSREDNKADDALSALLHTARPVPEVPADFAHAVWRRIEQTEASERAGWGWLDRWVEWLIRPRMAMAGLALVVVISGAAGMMSGTAVARQTALHRYLAAVSPMEH